VEVTIEGSTTPGITILNTATKAIMVLKTRGTEDIIPLVSIILDTVTGHTTGTVTATVFFMIAVFTATTVTASTDTTVIHINTAMTRDHTDRAVTTMESIWVPKPYGTMTRNLLRAGIF
jgi:hypothetical protein